MSEHFLGSNKAFEILANLGLDPLTLGTPGTRPDARRVSKVRLLSQTSANTEVTDRRISAITQDCRS